MVQLFISYEIMLQKKAVSLLTQLVEFEPTQSFLKLETWALQLANAVQLMQ